MSASEVLGRTRQAESGLYASPLAVHQTIQVEEVEIRPTRRTHEGHLAVWANGADHFALRWEDQAQLLRHAVWHPAASQEYVYDSGAPVSPRDRSVRPEKVSSLTELAEYGLTLEELETSFIRWLDSQGWRPISFGADFAAFANQSGVTVVTERIRTRAGRPGIRITARRLQAKIWIELRMEVDSASYRPTIEAVRFETASRAVEFRLSVDRIELLQPASIRAAVYEPDPRLTRPSSPPPDARRLQRATPSLAISPSVHVSSSPDVEVEALYALHRVKACLGDDLAVQKTAAGSWRVLGLVPSIERKNEILSALAGVSIDLDIRTFHEAGADAPYEPEPKTLPSATATVVNQATRRLPMEDLLSSESLKPQLEVPQLSNGAVTLSQSILAASWALQDLADRFPEQRIHQLSDSSRHRIEEMVRDHERDVQELLTKLEEHLGPLLSVLGPDVVRDVSSAIPSQSTEPDWRVACLAICRSTRRLDKLVHGLFAGTDLDDEPPALAFADLLAELRALQVSAPRFGTEVTTDFLEWPRSQKESTK